MYDLGDTVGLAVNLTNANGAAANAATVVLTITLPDGTTESPSVTNPPATTGAYTLDYVPTAPGRYGVRWAFTTPTAAFTDTFDVREAAPPLILSLRDAKAHLNIAESDTTHDDEIRDHIEGVSRYIESKVGPVVRRTETEVVAYGGDSVLMLRKRRVLSVTSVVVLRDDSEPVTLASIDIDENAGILRLVDGTSFPTEPFRITYVVGRTIVPADIILATKLMLAFTWETQRGGAGTPLQGGGPGDFLSLGVLAPPRVLTLLEASADKAGFA